MIYLYRKSIGFILHIAFQMYLIKHKNHDVTLNLHLYLPVLQIQDLFFSNKIISSFGNTMMIISRLFSTTYAFEGKIGWYYISPLLHTYKHFLYQHMQLIMFLLYSKSVQPSFKIYSEDICGSYIFAGIGYIVQTSYINLSPTFYLSRLYKKFRKGKGKLLKPILPLVCCIILPLFLQPSTGSQNSSTEQLQTR